MAPAIIKHCSRFITLSVIFTHITRVLKQLHWLAVEQRIIFKISIFVFKTIHGVSPIYLCSLVKPYDPPRGNMRSANKLLLTGNKSKTFWERDNSLYPQQRPGMHSLIILELRQ